VAFCPNFIIYHLELSLSLKNICLSVLTAFAEVVDAQVLLPLARRLPQNALVDVRVAVRAAHWLLLVLRTVLGTPAARLPVAVHVAAGAERAVPFLAHFCNTITRNH